ncbi:MAG: alpha/beta fold hydrolase [Kofleriaceae bacterium]
MPARLHHERIARSDSNPERWLLLTHGFFGAGNNWRGIARKVTERRPEWGIVLVDLRLHGRSGTGDPPHTLAACAGDLAALGIPVAALAGHSFGGKVVLAARAQIDVQQTWVLDASPSARAGDAEATVPRVLALLERLPRSYARREDFIAAIEADGHASSLAQWLAMNLVASGDGYVLRLELPALRELLADYFATDLWSALADPARGDVEVVVATRARTLSTADRDRLGTMPPHVHRRDVDADHWLHIEAAPAVVELFATLLP